MADASHQNGPEKKEAPDAVPAVSRPRDTTAPKEVTSSRVDIAGALIEGQEGGEMIDTGEVRETMAEAREVKGDGTGGAKKKDDGQAGQAGAAAASSFTFDEQNLPPVPEMIKKIEDTLRADIRKLERDARRYQGGFFREPNHIKLNETLREIRRKNVLLKRLVSMASEALKRLFLQMFGAKRG